MENAKKGKKNFLVLVISVVVVVAAVLGVALYAHNARAEGMCGPTAGTAFVAVPAGIYTVDGMGVEVFILRGIALGEISVSDTDSNDNLPPCYSQEVGLRTFRNLSLTARDGTKILLVKGVGNDSTVAEADPTPLP